MADIRQTLDTLLDEIGGDSLKALILDALDAEKLKWGLYKPDPCEECGHRAKPKKVQVDAPDIAARTKAITLLIDQAKGKPPETHKVTVRPESFGAKLEDMSNEELEAIIRGDVVYQDGELEEAQRGNGKMLEEGTVT